MPIQIRVKVCLTSNIGRGYKVPSYAAHPAKAFFRAGLPFTLSCDNTMLSGDESVAPDPTAEILHFVYDVFGEGEEAEAWKAVRFGLHSGIRAAFGRQEAEWVEQFINDVDNTFKRHGVRA